MKVVLIILYLVLSCAGSSGAAAAENSFIALESLPEYINKLVSYTSKGGTIFCDDCGGNVREDFHDCTSFQKLKERGYYGVTTREIYHEEGINNACQEIKTLQQATIAPNHYFDLRSDSWWKTFPATIIPMSGGIYNTESWKAAVDARDALVLGKRMEQLMFHKVTTSADNVKIIIESLQEEECGEIQDYLQLTPVLLADFDGDNIAELLVRSTRHDWSTTCSIGTGYALGGSSLFLIKKEGPEAIATLKKYVF